MTAGRFRGKVALAHEPHHVFGGVGRKPSVALVVGAQVAPLRFWLEVGALERTLVPGNRDLRDALIARGYDVT